MAGMEEVPWHPCCGREERLMFLSSYLALQRAHRRYRAPACSYKQYPKSSAAGSWDLRNESIK